MYVCTPASHPSISVTGQGQSHIKRTAEAGSNMAELAWDKPVFLATYIWRHHQPSSAESDDTPARC